MPTKVDDQVDCRTSPVQFHFVMKMRIQPVASATGFKMEPDFVCEMQSKPESATMVFYGKNLLKLSYFFITYIYIYMSLVQFHGLGNVLRCSEVNDLLAHLNVQGLRLIIPHVGNKATDFLMAQTHT